MPKYLIDTGFWIGLFDRSDQFHQSSVEIYQRYLLTETHVLLPWPLLYEILNTHFVRNAEWINLLRLELSKHQVVYLDDSPFRNNALEGMYKNVESDFFTLRTLSLTDRVLREILRNENTKISHLITFNPSDFLDICLEKEINLISFKT